jgi:hypothetical protein
VATLIKKETGLETELKAGGRGEFTVWVGTEIVARKTALGFPSENEVLAAVHQALAAG